VVGNPGPHIPYATLLEGQEPVQRKLADESDPHLLTIYTSGTTGKPKGAVINNSNVVAQMEMADDLFPPKPEDRVLCVLPLFTCSR